MDHKQLLHALARSKTKVDHRRAIQGVSPDAARAMTRLALELTRHGKGPKSDLSKAQLRLLSHPGSTHADFVKATSDQHGEGLGSFLGGLAKGLINSPAARSVASSLASKAAEAITKKLAA